MIKKEYRVVAVQAAPFNEAILLVISPIITLPPHGEETPQQGTHVPDPTKVLAGPLHETEDAKQAREMMKGIFSELMNAFQQMGIVPPRGLNGQQAVGTSAWPVLLSKQEYEELGKPAPFDTINLTFAHETEPTQPVSS